MRITYLILLTMAFNDPNANAQRNSEKVKQIWATDTSMHKVPLNEFTALLKRDEITPIDSPKFWNKTQSVGFFFDHEPVISIELNKAAKAYPLSILMYHEIVNDVVGGIPVTATYCPLCNAAIVFDRKLKHNTIEYNLDFGVSGMLRNSDMIMWDRQTETWWQQFTGEALVGQLSGAMLTLLPSQLISYKEFFDAYPEGLILSYESDKDSVPYGKNPYVSYDNMDIKQPRLFKENVDTRLPAMERVVNVYCGTKDKIYPLTVLREEKVINDNCDGYPLVLFFKMGLVSVLDKKEIRDSKDIGTVTVFIPKIDRTKLTFTFGNNGFTDDQTKSLWDITGTCIEGKYKGKKLQKVVHGNHFAFAWFAFYPNCEIYKK